MIDKLSLVTVYPEIFLLLMACAITLVDLSVKSPRRTLTYVLTMLTLAVVAAWEGSRAMNGTTLYGFNSMLVNDAMGNWLKCFATVAVMVTLVYGRPYSADRDMLRGGEIFSLSMFSLLGMFVMISGNHFLVIYLGLELLTLSSYALVALRRDNATATEAAMKYFVLGAMASGFLLYGFWLPDSMEGPTPISALIHAATMVTAGIFMVARMSPLFELSDTALNFIMVIGAITALFMGFLGIIQNDIKRVVAYSTLSQLGYMTVALGASAYSVAVFHLMTHAFFKALLFLGAGSVIMGVHHNQDIRWMGGLRKYMPITWITSLLGSLALIGTPFFSGFYSKDSIIEAVHETNLPGTSFAYFAVMAGVFITAFYSFRMYFLVFHGKERYDQNPDAHHGHDDHHAHDAHDDHGHGHHDAGKPHESPWVVTLPLILLAIPSVIVGFIFIEPMLFGDFFKDAIFVDGEKHPAMAGLKEIFHGATAMALHGFSTLPFWLALGGVVTSYYMYMINPALPTAIKRICGPIYTLLENKYYLDWFNENVLARGARMLGTVFWKVGDRFLIDGVIVNGSWKVVGAVSSVVRWFQTGFIYHYALAMILGVFGLVTYFLLFNN